MYRVDSSSSLAEAAACGSYATAYLSLVHHAKIKSGLVLANLSTVDDFLANPSCNSLLLVTLFRLLS